MEDKSKLTKTYILKTTIKIASSWNVKLCDTLPQYDINVASRLAITVVLKFGVLGSFYWSFDFITIREN